MSDKGLEGHEVISFGVDVFGLFELFMEFGKELNDWTTKARDAPDPMMESLRKLHASLNEIEDFALAAWVTSREDNLAFLLAHSSAALQTANEFLQSGQPGSSPEWAAKIALADRDSLIAVQTFTGAMEGGFWLRPESIKAISHAGDPTSFHNGWMPHIPDRAEVDSFGRVWDYRWALPAAVYTITVRLVVLKAIGTDASATRREVRRYNRFIASVFQKMESGIRSLDEMTPLQIQRIPTHGVPIAVADIYGGFYIGGLFDPFFNAQSFTRVPFPAELIVPTSGKMEDILNNAQILTKHWRHHVRINIGLPELLQFASALENMLVVLPPPPPTRHIELFSGGGGTPPPGGGIPNVGQFFGVRGDGDLRWYRYAGAGDPALSGLLVWHPGTGNPIGNGWGNFEHLLGCGDGVILGFEKNGDLRWYRYEGRGEEDDPSRWHPNSSNIIDTGWQVFQRIFVAPRVGPFNSRLMILGVADNGDLHWYSYDGNGEDDPNARGWHPNSGNRIGTGWQNFRHIHGSGNVFFCINENGDLLWYSYNGQGEADVSGLGWHPNSGSPIGRGWQGMRHIFGGVSDVGEFGHVIMAVDQNDDLFWYKYLGEGESDITGSLGWHENSGNRIGDGW